MIVHKNLLLRSLLTLPQTVGSEHHANSLRSSYPLLDASDAHQESWPKRVLIMCGQMMHDESQICHILPSLKHDPLLSNSPQGSRSLELMRACVAGFVVQFLPEIQKDVKKISACRKLMGHLREAGETSRM